MGTRSTNAEHAVGHLNRREALVAGASSVLGVTLPGLLQARSTQNPSRRSATAKSCIVVCLLGGPPQHETWDPKPEAPEEIRGPFRPIASSVPGLHVGELMPRLAERAQHFSVLRAVSTRDNAHSSSGYYMLTGVPHVPQNVENARPGAPNNWPSFPAIVNRLLSGTNAMPASVVVPDHIWNDGNIPWPGQDGGFLGRTSDPWLLHADPSRDDFRIEGLSMPMEVNQARFEGRQGLVQTVNRGIEEIDRAASLRHFGDRTEQAVDLMRSAAVRNAFDLSREPRSRRDRYGTSRFAQSLLLARRLVEAGVPLVQVNWPRLGANIPNQGTWDTHAKNAESLKEHLMPLMDRAVSALLDDLIVRGLLDETLVYWMGEFGRTPRHNGAAGRDHWGPVFSAALAGGGVRAGFVHGASDRIGAYPRDGVVRPEDLTATVFHLMGIDPHTEVRDLQNRPVAISRGEVVRQILA